VQNFALSDRVLPLQICINARARRFTLRIEPGGQALRVTVPPGACDTQIANFLVRWRGWIEARVAKLPKPVDEGSQLRPGIKIPYLGTPHLLVHRLGRGVTHLENGREEALEQFLKSVKRFSDKNCGKNKKLEQSGEPSETKTALEGRPQIILYGDVAHLPRHVRDFLQMRAKNTITPLVASFAQEVGRKPQSIRYKDTKSRWGSCTAQGDLSFSWRIIMAPASVVRYLVAHEVSHLVEMNHGSQFWQLCEKLSPDTKRCRAWLKRNGQALHAINFD